jgi:hypothetical protein
VFITFVTGEPVNQLGATEASLLAIVDFVIGAHIVCHLKIGPRLLIVPHSRSGRLEEDRPNEKP